MNDWIEVVKEYFGEKTKELKITELGWGTGTFWLVDNFKEVVSLEYTRFDYPKPEITAKNWKAQHITEHPDIERLDFLLATNFKERGEWIEGEVKKIIRRIPKNTDVLLIDFGCHFRGEVFEKVKGKYPYIILHDINDPAYNYKLEKVDYVSQEGCGTAIIKN